MNTIKNGNPPLGQTFPLPLWCFFLYPQFARPLLRTPADRCDIFCFIQPCWCLVRTPGWRWEWRQESIEGNVKGNRYAGMGCVLGWGIDIVSPLVGWGASWLGWSASGGCCGSYAAVPWTDAQHTVMRERRTEQDGERRRWLWGGGGRRHDFRPGGLYVGWVRRWKVNRL